MSHQSPDLLAETLNALAHKRRVLIFRSLHDDPQAGQSFAHLAQQTGLCDSSLTHHLRVMERSGIVKRQKAGATSHYSLSVDGLRVKIQKLLADCVEIPLQNAGRGPRLSIPA